MTFEPVTDVVRQLLDERREKGVRVSAEVDRLYGISVDEVELRCFKLLDWYVTKLLEAGHKVERGRPNLSVLVTVDHIFHKLQVCEKLTRKPSDSGKKALQRTGHLCIKAGPSTIVQEPRDDLTATFPRVLQNVTRRGADRVLMRRMALERESRHQFTKLQAAGNRIYGSRIDSTLREFQRLTADAYEARRAKRILAKLEAAAAPIDAATIQLLQHYVAALDPLNYGAGVALRTLTYILHGEAVGEDRSEAVSATPASGEKPWKTPRWEK